jgi:hypothetical protein
MIVQKMQACVLSHITIHRASCCETKATGPTKLNSKTPYCGTLEEQQLPRHHIQQYFNQIIGGLMTQ